VGALVDLRTRRTRPHPRRGATLGFGEKRQQRRWEPAAAADAEGRRDLRRDAREGGEGDGRGWPRVYRPIYISTDRSESLDRRWTVGRSWALIENDPRYCFGPFNIFLFLFPFYCTIVK